MKNFKILFIYLFIQQLQFAQTTSWKVFTNEQIGIDSSAITCIVEDKQNNIWLGTSGEGIFKFDGTGWVKFDSSTISTPTNYIWTAIVDSFDNKWFGTFGLSGGLIKYDNTNWKIFNVADYGIDGSTIFSMALDSNNILWMGTYWDGLVMFDTDTTWKIYNSSNSGLLQPQEEINCVAIDDSNNLWYGSDGWGGGKFDLISEWQYYTDFNNIDYVILSVGFDSKGNTWFGGWNYVMKIDNEMNISKYSYQNSSPRFTKLIADSNNTVWFASEIYGFLRLDYSTGEIWTKLYPKGYGLDSIGCTGLMRDNYGNFWIGYNNGYLAMFNTNGIVGIEENESNLKIIPTAYKLFQNYPNPFNPTTTIKYSIPQTTVIPNLFRDLKNENFAVKDVKVKLIIYDVLGREVATLVNEKQSPGSYSVMFNAGNLSSGLYFYKLTAGEFSQTKKMLLLK